MERIMKRILLSLLSLLFSHVMTVMAAPEDSGDDATPPLIDYPINVELQAVAKIMPEFGGAYFDEEGSLVVWAMDTSKSGLEERYGEVLMTVYGDDLAARGQYIVDQESDPPAPGTQPNVVLREAKFSVLELAKWQLQIKKDGPYGVMATDLDERANRLGIQLIDESAQEDVIAYLASQGIPQDALNFTIYDPIYNQATLHDYNPILKGGLQIEQGMGLCTLGFPVVDGAQLGMITNSHCTKTQGALDRAVISQGGTVIGREHRDPPYTNCTVNRTPALCRNSDSAFIRYDDQMRFHNNIIAKPASNNTGNIKITGAPFVILSEGPPAMVGERVHKVGRTTGWTTGVVTVTDRDAPVFGTSFVNLNQTFVASLPGETQALSQSGDSGSPWFRIRQNAANAAELLGIHWGGNIRGTRSVYSPIGNIEQDLGPLQVMGFGPELPTCEVGEDCCWIMDDPRLLGDGPASALPRVSAPRAPCGVAMRERSAANPASTDVRSVQPRWPVPKISEPRFAPHSSIRVRE
jgi:hypothetical protein